VSRDRVGSQHADRASTPHYVTLLGLCNDLLRGRWTIAVLAVCCAIVSAFVLLVRPRTYTATASFVPDVVQPLRPGTGAPSLLDAFGGAALQGGASRSARLPSVGFTSGLSANRAPLEPLDTAFYRILLQSPAFVRAVAGSQFTIATPGGTRTGTAADVYGLPPGPAEHRLDDARRRLAREIASTSNDSSNIVTLSVRTTDPQFARAAAERLLEALLEQNRRMTDARGAAQVAYLTRATLEARSELRVAQDEFARFLASNRAFGQASRVALEFRRLDEDVVEKRQHYADLALQLERAKLDVSRAVQLISVVARPETPSRPDPRGVLRASIVGAVGGAALAALIVLTGAQLKRLRDAGFRDLAALEAEWRAARRFTPPRNRVDPSGVATVAPGGAG
jgi:LPS O-antigen subunit length determinant protein (WzzB/FepE family)